MKRNSLLTLVLVLTLVTAARADDVDDMANAVESKYDNGSAATTTLVSSVINVAKVQAEREKRLDLAAVKMVEDFLKEPPISISDPPYVPTYRGLLVPRASDHDLDGDTKMVSVAGKVFSHTPAVVLEGKMKGALWFPLNSTVVREDVTVGGIKKWRLNLSFLRKGAKRPELPPTMRIEKLGADYDKFGHYINCTVINPVQDDASTATAPTTTTVAPPAPPATPPAGGRVRRQPANCRI